MTVANNGKKRFVGLILAIIATSSIAAIVAYGSIAPVQQQWAEAEDTVVVTKTLTSMQDPGAGHESHQAAMFLPPLGGTGFTAERLPGPPAVLSNCSRTITMTGRPAILPLCIPNRPIT